MRRFVSLLALSALTMPVAVQAQIAEIDLPPSDVADAGAVDAGYGDDDTGYDDDRDNDDGGDASDRVADILDDPRRQADIADAMSDMMRALMTIRVGPIVDAARRIDPDAEIAAADPDATIGDIASRGDPDYEDRLEDGIRSGTAVSATMVREFARMMPALIAVAKDLGAQAEKAIRARGRR